MDFLVEMGFKEVSSEGKHYHSLLIEDFTVINVKPMELGPDTAGTHRLELVKNKDLLLSISNIKYFRNKEEAQKHIDRILTGFKGIKNEL